MDTTATRGGTGARRGSAERGSPAGGGSFAADRDSFAGGRDSTADSGDSTAGGRDSTADGQRPADSTPPAGRPADAPAGAGEGGRRGDREGVAETPRRAPGAPVRTADFRFDLPADRIADRPARRRGDSRLLHLAADGRVAHRRFADLPELLRPGDLLVRNRSRVIPARLSARREGSGGRVEVLVLPEPGNRGVPEFTALTRPACRPGVRLSVGTSVRLLVGEGLGGGRRRLSILEGASDGFDLAEREGSTPLPPYLRRGPGRAADRERPFDRERYQTVYAEEPGSVAAPTAGLHFETGVFDLLAGRGIETADLVLHVGYGTFSPVRAGNARDHRLGAEWFRIPEDTERAVRDALRAGHRVVAVGTTTVRALETMGAENEGNGGGREAEDEGEPLRETSLLILPGHRFRVVSAMLTNFHLPESSLLMLVAALGGVEPVLAAYREAVRERYRFYSYGDAMFVEGNGPGAPPRP